MKEEYRVVSIYRSSNGDLMTGFWCNTYDESIDLVKANKNASGHSIHKTTTLSNNDTTIVYYRGYAIFRFNGIKNCFIFDMTGDIPIFIGKCRFYTPAYTFIDTHREYGVKDFTLIGE